MKIQVEENEEIIFQMVLECSRKYYQNSQPRVAGGWVRDKIMGNQSFDLDITLNNISGYDFACKLREMNINKISTAGLVKQNPDKSKHLETAVLNVNGLFIDFVNLRKETYTVSRIPLIEFGTPYEDAHRRDLTINSLFYNLETKEIEDFTGKGIEDLQNRIIRTPLEPETTFRDDPLRILRIFRFYSKFNFYIYDDIHKTLRNEELKKQLAKKVSKERINIEIFKMIEYPKGHLGILEIIKTGYAECVIGTENFLDYKTATIFYKNIVEILEIILNNQFVNNLPVNDLEIPNKYSKSRWIFNLYLILHQFAKTETLSGKKTAFTNAVIVKNYLLCSKKIHLAINRIEKGLKVLDNINLSVENYDLFLIVFYFKDLWFEIFVLECAIRKQNSKNYDNILNIINAIINERIPERMQYKSTFNISILSSLLDIKPKYISYFYSELIIFRQSKQELSDDDLISHLKNNKKEIISRHAIFK